MASRRLRGAILASLLGALPASAATLTITPDKSTYLAGETITLSIFGDAEGSADNVIYGRLLFSAGLANHVDSSQAQLTSFGGSFPWVTGPLFGGADFAEAFNQTPGTSPLVPDGPLTATVTLLATAPGVLDYDWQTEGLLFLDFFGLTNASGGSVTIVPEPGTGGLLGLGLLALGRRRRRRFV